MEGGGHSVGMKMVSRYDPATEREAREWIRELTGTDIQAGPEHMFQQLRDGTVLIQLIKKVYDGTSELPPNAKDYQPCIVSNGSKVPFKQMENIEIFLRACKAYGVPNTGIFPTNNLFENRNMGNVLDCIQLLGTEAQRHSFQGPPCGQKPTTSNKRSFSYEKLKAGQGIIGLQAGSNKFASQKGMSMGSVRHVSDIKADDMTQEGQGIINLQCGTNQFASQKGMSMGSVRHVSDIKSEPCAMDSHGILNLQSGTNKYASQKGMSMGSVRHVSDIKSEDMSRESQGVINLQAGTNRFASQKGMSFGSTRHIGDIRVAPINQQSHAIITLQAGTNRGASQRGMSFGAVRNIGDIQPETGCMEGESVIRLQAGTNRLANQKGLNFGKSRGINDIRVIGQSNNDYDQFKRYYDYDTNPSSRLYSMAQDDDEGWL